LSARVKNFSPNDVLKLCAFMIEIE
jgi:hypothetical protein